MRALSTGRILVLTLGLLTCNFPHDPEHSWREAGRENLLVGIVNHPPFSLVKENGFGGSEVAMIEEFAAEHKLSIKWLEGNESLLVKKMKDYKLHLVVGGFEKETVWAKEVGITMPYDGKHVWLVARGENKLVEQVEKYFIRKKQDL